MLYVPSCCTLQVQWMWNLRHSFPYHPWGVDFPKILINKEEDFVYLLWRQRIEQITPDQARDKNTEIMGKVLWLFADEQSC